MPKYKVTQKQGSKTLVSTFEAKNHALLLDFLKNVSTAKVTCIQQVVYEDDDNYPIDDFNYFKQYKAFCDNNNRSSKQILIHHVKKNLNEDELANLIKNVFEVNSLNIQSVKCRLFY